MEEIIDRAGAFPVKSIPCPNLGRKVDRDRAPTGVLHTTEGGWKSSLDIFKDRFAPHFMLGMNEQDEEVQIAQLVPVGIMGASTRGHNDQVLVQIEMVSFSRETPWLPDQRTLDALCSLMNVCWDRWRIPLTHPWIDGDYGRYGINPHRTAGKFGIIAGWYGHGDMPTPDVHWDPGNLRWSRVFQHAHELTAGKEVAAHKPPSPSLLKALTKPTPQGQACHHEDVPTKIAAKPARKAVRKAEPKRVPRATKSRRKKGRK
jgi:hypothetical protein